MNNEWDVKFNAKLFKIVGGTFLSRKPKSIKKAMIRNQYNRIQHPALGTKCDTKFVLQKMLLRKECFTKTTL